MKTPLLCRLFGHRWKPSYIGEVIRRRPRWVYIDHHCTRCYATSVLLPPPAIEVEGDLPMTGAYAPQATCRHGIHPYDCEEGCDPHTNYHESPFPLPSTANEVRK
jgi:hypothetical protein